MIGLNPGPRARTVKPGPRHLRTRPDPGQNRLGPHKGSTVLIIIIIEGLSLLQSIPPTTADKQTQAQKRRGSRSRKLLGAKAKSTVLTLCNYTTTHSVPVLSFPSVWHAPVPFHTNT